MIKLNTINVAHVLIEQSVAPGSLCIDATAGRGYDTVFLANLVGETGRVIAFDIQEAAVASTQVLLEEKQLADRVKVYHTSHAKMAEYAEAESVDCIMFNFGYLPGGDHQIATQKESSIAAIESGLKLLKKKGIMSLCIYQGGDSGFDEKNALMDYIQTLDSKKYAIVVTEMINRPNFPPISVTISKER